MADGNVEDISNNAAEDVSSLSHDEVLRTAQRTLQELLTDPVLRDIPTDVTASELKAKIDLEKGRAFIVNLKRTVEADNEGHPGYEHIPLIANQRTTVGELKQHAQREIARRVKEEGGGMQQCISWKYVWRTYWLVHGSEKLSDDKKLMKDYGIRHGSEIAFLKRLQRK